MLKRILVCISSFSLFFTGIANAYLDDLCMPSFYVGADFQLRHIPFQKEFGGNMYKKDYPQGNLYIGVKGNEYIGIETGYEFSRTRKRTVSLPGGSVILGIPEDAAIQENVIIRFRGMHCSIITFLPVCLPSFSIENLRILAAIGLINLKIRTQTLVTEVGGIPAAEPLRLMQSKYVLRLMGGLQYMFTDWIGVRANLRWENTKKLNDIAPIRSASDAVAKAKNSMVFGLGVLVEF